MKIQIGFGFLVIFFTKWAVSCGTLQLKSSFEKVDWLPQRQVIERRIEVLRSETGAACDFFISMTSVKKQNKRGIYQLRNGEERLSYRVSQKASTDVGASLIDFKSKIDSRQVISSGFSNDSVTEQALNYFFHLEGRRNQLPAYGFFKDRLKIRVYQGDPEEVDTLEPDDELILPIAVFVRQIVDISVVPKGGGFRRGQRSYEIDFSILNRGKKKHFDILVRSNERHRLSISSRNSGVMRHINERVSTTVPYGLSIDNQLIPLGDSVPDQILGRNAQREGRRQVRHRAIVEIGDVKDRIAGEYRDYLRFTVRSRR